MNKKIKLTLEIIALVAVILIIVSIIKNNTSSNEDNATETLASDILYNEISGKYYIKDEETGEVLHTGESEEELYIYTIDSDYEVWDPDEKDSEEEY